VFDEILSEVEKASGPLTVNELSVRLGVEKGALEKMLEFLEKKNKLSVRRSGVVAGQQCLSCKARVNGCGHPESKEGGAS